MIKPTESLIKERQEIVIALNPIFTAIDWGTEAAQYFKVCSMPSNIQQKLEISRI